jgi:hypothetical protein
MMIRVPIGMLIACLNACPFDIYFLQIGCQFKYCTRMSEIPPSGLIVLLRPP